MSRAPLNLSREMKLLLLLLLMVALIGLWYVWNKGRSAPELTETTPPIANGSTEPAPGPDSTGTDNNGPDSTGATEPGSEGTDPVAVAPNGEVQVEVIPPFPTGETPTGGALSGSLTEPSTPDGINPKEELARTPGGNPFQPLSIDAPAGTLAGTPPATGTDSGASGTGADSVTTTPVDVLGQGGAISIPEIPVRPGTSVIAGLPSIPGGTGNSGANSGASSASTGTPRPNSGDNSASTPNTAIRRPTVTVTPIKPEVATTTRPNPTGSTGRPNTGTPNAGTPNTATGRGQNPGTQNPGTQNPGTDRTPSLGQNPGTEPPTRPAAPPPVAGVSVPRPGTLTPGTLNASVPGVPTAGASSAADVPGGALPPTGNPQVITELGSGDAAIPDSARLDAAISNESLEFNAAVLGPVNTAIFRSKGGFVVVAVGQTLPETNIILKEVSATSATLALDNETKTLKLEKR